MIEGLERPAGPASWSTARRPATRLLAVLTTVGMLLWLLGPIAGILVLTRRSGALTVTREAPVWAPIRTSRDPDLTPVGLHLDWSDPPTLVAPAWGGLVEQVSVSAGQTIHSGDQIAVVGGVARIAWASERPFSRSLRPGDSGADVVELDRFLSGRGYGSPSGSSFGPSTAAAVKRLAASLGAASDGAFDPGWFVFLPFDAVTVTKRALVVGAPAPPPGTTLFEGLGRVTHARLAPPPTGDQLPGTTPATTPPSAAAAAVTAPEGTTLSLDGTALRLEADRRTVVAQDLAAIEPLVQSLAGVVAATLERPPRSGDYVVPAAAVFSAADGSTCVVARSRSGATGRAIEVTVVGAPVSRTVIRGDLPADGDVEVAPPAARRRC